MLSSQQGAYEGSAADLRDQIRALVDAGPSGRPLVNFFAITVWGKSIDDVVAELLPLLYTANGLPWVSGGRTQETPPPLFAHRHPS